jgi:hypothetical protein
MWRLSVWVVRSALTLMCGVASSALGQETPATQGSADRTAQGPTKEGKTEDQATQPDDEQAKLEFGMTVVADFYLIAVGAQVVRPHSMITRRRE